MNFIAAHKIALLISVALVGGVIMFLHRKGQQTDFTNGVPVNPYSATPPPDGSFDLSNLLPSGPAGPVLDPSAGNTGDGSANPAPDAVVNVATTKEPGLELAPAPAAAIPFTPITPVYGTVTPAGAVTFSGQVNTGGLGSDDPLRGTGGPITISMPHKPVLV